MNSENDIKKFFDKASVNTNPDLDKAILNGILSVRTRTTIWKVILKSHLMKIAALITIFLLLMETKVLWNNPTYRGYLGIDKHEKSIEKNVSRFKIGFNSDTELNQANGLRCFISIEPNEIQVGQSFVINIDFKNVSSSDITFYYQYLYKAEKLVIKNEKSQVAPFTQTIRYKWPNLKEFYQEINAGQTYKQQITGRIAYTLNQTEEDEEKPLIIDFYDIAQHLDNLGTFTATLQLASDFNDVNIGTNFGFSNIWTGKLVSNEVKFIIKSTSQGKKGNINDRKDKK